LGYFQGFCDSPEKYISDLFNPDFVSYKPRPEMEEDPSFKQLIPYVVFRYQTPDGETQLFSYARGKGQGESRLHDKWSIGIGGHISSVDNSENEPYRDGMRRELEEEVMIDTPYSERCVGLINDDESEVGKVHLGGTGQENLAVCPGRLKTQERRSQPLLGNNSKVLIAAGPSDTVGGSTRKVLAKRVRRHKRRGSRREEHRPQNSA
jgi:predicted NUDIX family phosphoesterase